MFDFDALESHELDARDLPARLDGQVHSDSCSVHNGGLQSPAVLSGGSDDVPGLRAEQPEQGTRANRAALLSLRVDWATDREVALWICGVFYPCGSLHGRVAFKRSGGATRAAFVYWRDGPEHSGWWIGASLGSGARWAHHPDSLAWSPPASGWHVPHDGPVEPQLFLSLARPRGQGTPRQSNAGSPRGATEGRALGTAASTRPPYRCLLYHGVVYLPYMSPELLDLLRARFVLQHRDVVVVSHPRCGTTWCQTIVLNLLHYGRARCIRDPMMEAPWIEASICKGRISVDGLNARGGGTGALKLRCLKTHAPAHLAPWQRAERGAKILIVTRDPRDAAVSHYHHILNSSAYRFRGAWNEFCSLFLSGGVEGGDFWQWHEGWTRRAEGAHGSQHEEYLWVRYEDLILDLHGQVQRIAAFLDIERRCQELGVANLTDSEFEAIVAAVQFGAMSKLFAQRNALKEARGKRFDPQHLRNGVAGGWPERMSEAQSEQFCERTDACTAPAWTTEHWECRVEQRPHASIGA